MLSSSNPEDVLNFWFGEGVFGTDKMKDPSSTSAKVSILKISPHLPLISPLKHSHTVITIPYFLPSTTYLTKTTP